MFRAKSAQASHSRLAFSFPEGRCLSMAELCVLEAFLDPDGAAGMHLVRVIQLRPGAV